MSVSREKKHLWQMPHPLLPSRYEGKSQGGDALFWSTYATSSSEFILASCLGCPSKATNLEQENKLAANFFNLQAYFLLMPYG
jgi:hypothetical protein